MNFIKSVGVALAILILAVLFTDVAMGSKVKPVVERFENDKIKRSPLCTELAKEGWELKRVITIIKGQRDISRRAELLLLIAEYRDVLRRMREEGC